MIDKMLVITDQDNIHTLALEKANDIATRCRCTVDIVSFFDKAASNQDIEQHREHLKQQIRNYFDESLPYNISVVVTDDLVAWTAQHCEDTSPDLVLKTGHRSEKLFYTPTDWQLLRTLNCPVLIASDTKWHAKPKILAAVDAGDTSQQQRAMDINVLRQARYWSQLEDCELHAVYSNPVPVTSVELGIVEVEQYERQNQAAAEQLLERLVEESGVRGVETHLEFGAAHKRIPSCANRLKADLVVVGSVGRTGLNGLLLGNTAEQVMHNLRTDILVVK